MKSSLTYISFDENKYFFKAFFYITFQRYYAMPRKEAKLTRE